MTRDSAHFIRHSDDSSVDSVLQLVDDAIYAAADLRNKNRTSKEVDDKLERALEALGSYETDLSNNSRANIVTVHERMKMAKAKDKSSSTTIFNLWKKMKLSPKVRLVYTTSPHANAKPQAMEDERSEPTTIVEFLLLKSLPDNSPTIVTRKRRIGDVFVSLPSFSLSES
jgi:hypothetical protein